MGSDPSGADGESLIEVKFVDTGDGDSLMIGFRRSLTAVDLNYAVEVSDNLQSWQRNAGEVLVTEQLGADRSEESATEWVTVRDLTIGSNRRFVRVEFSLIEP